MNNTGNIVIIEPRDNFQKVSKDIIFNKEVDFATLGIYVKVLALGKKFSLNIKGLATILGVSLDKVRKHFAVLEAAGYLRRQRVQGESGKFTGWRYEVSSVPFSMLTDVEDNRRTENTDVGENRSSENTDVYNRDIEGNRDIKKNNKDNTSNRFSKPTIEDIEAYCRERRNKVDAVAFFYHYESNGWKVGGAPMRDWHAAVITWERRAAASKAPARSTSQVVTDVDQFWK